MEFQEAARLRPEDADVQTNLGILLATRGDLPAAIRAFEAALRLDPNHGSAGAYLRRAQTALANQH